jgi:2-(1,2-epoxy-1,2-dihydrophenyl)acetyl-CoA isomerase
MRGLEKPIIAAVNGVAAGAGMSLALACDLRYAAESARFVVAFVRIGLVPDAGSLFFLPRLLGPGKAMELAWTGDPVSAQQALELGLVNEVVPDALAKSQEVAARLAHGPATAIALIKRAINQSHELPLERVLELEANYQTIAARQPDFAEGITAFIEKRPANFG